MSPATYSSRPPPGPVAVIVNPRSANGRTARTWATLRSQVEAALGRIQVSETRAPQHATELTRSVLRQDCRTLIVVGGDGTINEAVNGFFEGDSLIAPEAVLGLIPQGSGSDFRRTLAIPLQEKAALEIIRRGAVKKIDVIRAGFQTLEGRPCVRYGVNILSFGMGGAVAARANRSSKILGGRLSFQLATLLTTLSFRGNRVSLRLEGREFGEIKISNIAAGNGQYHGGGMWVCPRAVVDDGLLDVTIIRYFSPLEVLRNFPILYNGRLYEHPKVDFHRAARLEATAMEPTLIEVDGEPAGRLPLELSVLPRTLAVYVPEN